MKKILISGDSFSAVWPFTELGWSKLLAHRYDVTNLSQAGCGEYKILKQIESTNLSEFDLVIVSHTSPSRIHTPSHPLHKEGFHINCDLLANDICDRTSWFNPSLRTAQGWFKYHYDEQYQIDIYNLVRKKIYDLLEKIPYISLTHTDISRSLIIESNNIDFSNLWKRERGSINHYTIQGNRIIFETIMEHIGGK